MVEPMMTARQVAELLGVHENWVYDQAVSHAMPSYKIGGARRFDPQELRRWITKHRDAESELSAAERPKRTAPARVRPPAVRCASCELDVEKTNRNNGSKRHAKRIQQEQPTLFEI